MADLSATYREAMRKHPQGYALYTPQPSKILKPGMCGYLDERRIWKPIIDLTLGNDVLKAAGYTAVGPLQRRDPEISWWDPKEASTVSRNQVELEAEAGAAATGLPIDAEIAVSYSSTVGFGAVLFCEKEVVMEAFDHKDPFRAWLKANAVTILKNLPGVRDFGVYVVTSTHSCEDISIVAWDEPSVEVTLGLKVGAELVGKLGPKVSWMRGRSSKAWEHHV